MCLDTCMYDAVKIPVASGLPRCFYVFWHIDTGVALGWLGTCAHKCVQMSVVFGLLRCMCA